MLKTIFYSLGIAIMSVYTMIYLEDLLIPLSFAILIAILINPIVSKIKSLVKVHFIAYFVTVIGMLSIVGGVVYLLSDQLYDLFANIDSSNVSVAKIEKSFVDLGRYFGLPSDQVTNMLQNLGESTWMFLQTLISSGSNFLVYLGLSIVFGYFFSAYYRPVRLIIFEELEEDQKKTIRSIARESPTVIREYIQGMLLVMLILAVLNSLAFFIIGLDYAIVWGAIIGLLAIIPYVGSFIGLLLPLMYSISTCDGWGQPVAIMFLFLVIQALEGNLITPKIVGDKLDINPMVLIILLVIFGQIWGIPGIIISFPMVGILKIILEKSDDTAKVIADVISSKD